MAISKAAANKKYDELRAKLKKGDISQAEFKTAANRIYKMYHSKENAPNRTAVKAPPKPSPSPSPSSSS